MATIIKKDAAQNSPARPAVRGVAFDFQDLAGHADEYVDSVRREAAKVVQAAHAEAEAIRSQAERAGREAAEAAVEQVLNEKVGERMKTIRPALEDLVNQLTDARGAWLDHWEQSALELAARIAERIVRSELEHRPEVELTWIREALELASGPGVVTVRLNKADHENLGPQAEQLASAIGKFEKAILVADEQVSPGGCVVETQFGVIDQQIETQLRRLVDDLS